MAAEQVLTVAQMKAAEQALFDGGMTEYALMQRAGNAAAQWVWRIAANRKVTVLCGPGNNGGDGYVIAEWLRERGGTVSVVAPLPPATDAAKRARRDCKVAIAQSAKDIVGDVLVDCLFGSGLTRPLSAELTLLLRDLKTRHGQTIAIDLPSGIESDHGKVLSEELGAADVTLALGAWKHAHWMMPSMTRMGQRLLIAIGTQPIGQAAEVVGAPEISPPAADAHKYSRGLAMVIAGAMPGAAQLASLAALRSGSGYTKLVGAKIESPTPDIVGAEDVALALGDDRTGAVLVGPGLGRDASAHDLLQAAASSPHPIVLDADALHLVTPDILGDANAVIATPHEGELDALCKTFAVIGEGKRARVTALAKASGMVIVAKGPDTIIAGPDGRLRYTPPGSVWLSTAGTGDVLAGVILARLATGMEAFDAACEGAWLHARASHILRPPFAASDLPDAVGKALSECVA